MEVDVMKIAVITGASSGLGREFAKQINQHFVADRTKRRTIE